MNIKRIVALVAAGMIGVQLMGIGTALAGDGGSSECDFDDNALEITLGDDHDAYLQINGTKLECTVNGATDDQALSTIKNISVVMDDEEDSTSELYIDLWDATDSDLVTWPRFSSFDIDVYTELNIDGASTDSGEGNMRVVVGKSTVSFSGATATLGSLVPVIDIDGSPNRDSIDGSATSFELDLDGGAGNDTLKGGSARDYIDSSDGGVDFVYGNGGNDDILCAGVDFAWGGAGEDYLDSCWFTAPGVGDDEVAGTTITRLSYADVSGDVTAIFEGGGGSDCGTDADISGAAGVDLMPATMNLNRIYFGSGNDVLVNSSGAYNSGCINDKAFMGAGNDKVRDFDGIGDAGGNHERGYGVFGEAGNDVLWGANSEYDILHGGSGDDRMYGLGYQDILIGGPGNDQAWCGSGSDDFAKSSEVQNQCENLTWDQA